MKKNINIKLVVNMKSINSIIYNALSLFLPDKQFLTILFRRKMGYNLPWNNPQTYNEKLQWLKLYNRRPEYTMMVDKIEVKNWVAKMIGEEYIIPTLAVWSRAEEIDFSELPDRFVIKCNHNSGLGMFICKDKSKMDTQKVKTEVKKGLQENYYRLNREWPYKNVKRLVFAEKFMQDGNQVSLNDYKVMCFDGKVKLIELHEGRFTEEHTQAFYDRDWNKTSITQGDYGLISNKNVERPALLDEMVRLSEILSAGIPHVRVDWYIINNHLYFGEMTFFDGSGLTPWDRTEDDLLLGSWITLPSKTV